METLTEKPADLESKLSAIQAKIDSELSGTEYQFDYWRPYPTDMTKSGDSFAYFKKKSAVEDGKVEIQFAYKNPAKPNALVRTIFRVTKDPGDFNTEMLSAQETMMSDLKKSEGDDFVNNWKFLRWNPDPNEVQPNEDGSGKSQTCEAVFQQQTQGDDFYIVPHPMLQSFNRKQETDVNDDATVTAKSYVGQDYKRGDWS